MKLLLLAPLLLQALATPVVFVAPFYATAHNRSPLTHRIDLPPPQVLRIQNEMAAWSNNHYITVWRAQHGLQIFPVETVLTQAAAQRQLEEMVEIVRARIGGGQSHLLS